MIEIRNKQILIDGHPQILVCGEIHYFRLNRKDWQDRIDKLKAAGCNVVSSYVPWLCHEPIDGEIDLVGRTRPELDLGAFIDLCRDNGLLFFVRPGPFIMAEMKNEGLPYWVYEKHPDIVPVGWDGKTAPTRTVDYLAPGFLSEVRKWYSAVMGGVIAPRLHHNGGNIIGVQLDNEIGMLSWVSNSPDLTELVLEDFAAWLKRYYDADALKARYPFHLDDPEARRASIRSPKEAYAAELMHDLGYYMRGTNYRLGQRTGDGNDRIAFTGERHGFAAPVSPEGALNYTYPRMARVIQTVRAAADKLAIMDEEHDDVAFAFIPDYFMTECWYPNSAKMRNIVDNLQLHRAHSAWEVMARAMLLACYRFGCIDIQNKPIDPQATPVLVIASARYMHAAIQQKLVHYLQNGGNILLYGEVPTLDMAGNPCTILAEALNVSPQGLQFASNHFYLSVTADGWAAPRPEVRTHFAQVFDPGSAEVILRVYGTGEPCGFDTTVGRGRLIAIATAYECDIRLFKTALEKLGATAGLQHDCSDHGIFMTSTATQNGERFLHILNLDGLDKVVGVYERGKKLFGGRSILLQSKDAVMLPLNVSYHGVKVVYSTAEIQKVDMDVMEFRLTQPQDVIAIQTKRTIIPSERCSIQQEGDMVLVFPLQHAKMDDHFTLRFA